MQQAVVVSGDPNTAVGKFGGGLARISAPELGAMVITEA